MKVLVDISGALFNRIKTMIDNGKYSSLSNFILIAAENQLLLEETGSGSTHIDNNIFEPDDMISMLQIDFTKLKIPSGKISTVDLPSPEQLKYPTVKNTYDMYIWGQINRILPMKVALRVLCNYLANHQVKYIQIDDFNKRVSRTAVLLKQTLADKTGKVKGSRNSLGTGLPDDTEKSISRYTSHFLIYPRKDGIIDGGLGRLKLANILKNKKVGIGVTEPGWEFCCLKNPVLDEQSFKTESLSEEEKHFYLRHIAQHIPYEKQAFHDILHLIQKGFNNPTALNEQLRKIWPHKWSEAVINTQRSGLISRLAEVGLVVRRKDGIKVTYSVTDRGNNFLKKSYVFEGGPNE